MACLIPGSSQLQRSGGSHMAEAPLWADECAAEVSLGLDRASSGDRGGVCDVSRGFGGPRMGARRGAVLRRLI